MRPVLRVITVCVLILNIAGCGGSDSASTSFVQTLEGDWFKCDEQAPDGSCAVYDNEGLRFEINNTVIFLMAYAGTESTNNDTYINPADGFYCAGNTADFTIKDKMISFEPEADETVSLHWEQSGDKATVIMHENGVPDSGEPETFYRITKDNVPAPACPNEDADETDGSSDQTNNPGPADDGEDGADGEPDDGGGDGGNAGPDDGGPDGGGPDGGPDDGGPDDGGPDDGGPDDGGGDDGGGPDDGGEASGGSNGDDTPGTGNANTDGNGE